MTVKQLREKLNELKPESLGLGHYSYKLELRDDEKDELIKMLDNESRLLADKLLLEHRLKASQKELEEMSQSRDGNVMMLHRCQELAKEDAIGRMLAERKIEKMVNEIKDRHNKIIEIDIDIENHRKGMAKFLEEHGENPNRAYEEDDHAVQYLTEEKSFHESIIRVLESILVIEQ